MTINLMQAQKLQELGVKVKAQFVWFTVYADNKYWAKILYEGKLTEDDLAASETIYPAYNAEELLTMLKNEILISTSNGYVVMITGRNYQVTPLELAKITLTEALANKLIYDLENGIVSLEEVNK